MIEVVMVHGRWGMYYEVRKDDKWVYQTLNLADAEQRADELRKEQSDDTAYSTLAP